MGSTGPVSPPGWLTDSTTRLEKRGLREAHGGGLGGDGGAPQSTAEDRDAEASGPQGVFSQKGGEMKGHSQPPHGLVYWLMHYTPSMYTNINIAMYTFTWDLWPTQAPSLGRGPYGWHESGNLEEGRVLLPLSQHPQSVLSLCSSAGRAGPNTCGGWSPRGVSSDLPIWLSSQTLPRSSQPLCLSSPPGPGGGGCPCGAVWPP